MTDGPRTPAAPTVVRGVAFTGIRMLAIVGRLTNTNAIGLNDLPRLVARGYIRPIGRTADGLPVYGQESVAALVRLALHRARRPRASQRRRLGPATVVADKMPAVARVACARGDAHADADAAAAGTRGHDDDERT